MILRFTGPRKGVITDWELIPANAWGLISRLIAKLTGMTIAAWVNPKQGRSPLALADFSF